MQTVQYRAKGCILQQIRIREESFVRNEDHEESKQPRYRAMCSSASKCSFHYLYYGVEVFLLTKTVTHLMRRTGLLEREQN